MHVVLLIGSHVYRCTESEWAECYAYSPATTLILLILLGFEASLFGIFTIVMFCTQMSAIFSDETQIESLKNEEPKWAKKNRQSSLKSVFGSEVSVKWLSPFTKPNFKHFDQSLEKLLDV